MKEVTLYVHIKKSPMEVFAFTTDPAHTPKWIESIVSETASDEQVGVGTIYKNCDRDGNVNEYLVTTYEPGSCFQLDATHQDYKVKYSYREVRPGETELEYHEWSESGKLHAPFMQEILDNLKQVMETDYTTKDA